MITRPSALLSLALLAILIPQGICSAQSEPSPTKKKKGTVVRILCVQSLTGEQQEVILATKTEEGEWIERGTATLRSPSISSWIQVPNGLTHIARKEGDEMVSLGAFRIAPNLKRAVLVLVPDNQKNVYRTRVVDPEKLGFKKGKALILNYSNLPAIVKIGKVTKRVDPGQKVVGDIDSNEDGMYRLLIGHLGEQKQIIPCYDRFVSSDPNARKFILLFPDKATGLRAMSLSEFGPFD